MLESGHQRVTPNSTLTKYIESLIDLPVFGIKKGGTYIIWSPRTPTPREEQSAREALAREAHEGFRNATWYVDAQTIPTDSPGNTVTVSFDPEAARPYVSLRFNHSSSWSWFVYGSFNGGESKYHKGTAEFTNTLAYVTPELTGTKIWDIDGDDVPDDPTLRLTRTVTITPEEGEPYTTAPEIVNAEPVWSDGEDAKTRVFTYHDLPKYDPDGNEYTYHVAEASFTIGTGDDAVTYTTVRHSDGTYTVTPDKEDATPFVTTQDGFNITNAESEGFKFSKIWLDENGERVLWPEGKTITVKLNASTDEDESDKALDDVEVELSPFELPSGWEVEIKDSGTRAEFSTADLPTTQDGKELTYYVVEEQITGYTTTYSDNDRALDNGTITNAIETTEVEVVQLTADGEDVEGKTATLSASQSSYTFENLPKYKIGTETEIEYGVKEVTVPGYTTEIGDLTDGKITVTNTQVKTSVEVEKKWANADSS